jgi:predicted TIM-barrel fold metal-dependent hydrolase
MTLFGADQACITPERWTNGFAHAPLRDRRRATVPFGNAHRVPRLRPTRDARAGIPA